MQVGPMQVGPKQAVRRPAWRLPAGVTPGTWEYAAEPSIASGDSQFLQNTPLTALDNDLVLQHLPPPRRGDGGSAGEPADRLTCVADLGCGAGRTLAALWQAGFDCLGVDLSGPVLQQALREQAPRVPLAGRLVRANLVELGCLADGCVDHAVCLFSTLGMIRGRANRRQFLAHVARIVRPGGRFIVHVHNRNAAWRDRPSLAGWFRSAAAALRRRDAELGDRYYSYRGLGDMFLHTFSLSELRRDLTASGWKLRQLLPLSPTSDRLMPRPNWLPSLRAGGFVAVAEHAI